MLCSYIEYYQPLLYSRDEISEFRERCSFTPNAKACHVCHVARLWSASSRCINYPRLGKLILKLQHSETCLCGLWRSHRAKVLGPVTLIKHNWSIKIFPTPLQQLLQSRLVLPSWLCGLPNQCRVGWENHTFLHISIHSRRDLGILELWVRVVNSYIKSQWLSWGTYGCEFFWTNINANCYVRASKNIQWIHPLHEQWHFYLNVDYINDNTVPDQLHEDKTHKLHTCMHIHIQNKSLCTKQSLKVLE